MKAIKFIMGVAVALSLGFSAASCSNDDYDFTDTNKNIPQTDVKNTIAKAEVDVKYMFTEDFLRNFDATFVYTDSNGTEHREAIDTKNTTAKLQIEMVGEVVGKYSNVYTYNKIIETSIPQNINVHVDITEKATKTPTEKDYDYIGFGFNYKTQFKNIYGEVLKNIQGKSDNDYTECAIDTIKLSEYYDNVLTDYVKLYTFTFNFAKTGQCNVITQKLSK